MNELLLSLVKLIIAMREEGYTYRDINRELGLVDGTCWSSYRLIKRKCARDFLAAL